VFRKKILVLFSVVVLFLSGYASAELFKGIIDNTDIFRFITQTEIKPAAPIIKKAPKKEKTTTFTY
jgi:hypothetical protein